MNAKDIIYTWDEVKDLSDDELYQRLYECWNITNGKIEVWGKVELKHEKWAGVFKVKTVTENRSISYPIDVRLNIDSGVYLHPRHAKKLLDRQESPWIKCELILALPSEREKSGNPFLLSVKSAAYELLVKLPLLEEEAIHDLKEGVVLNDQVSSYLTESIYNLHFDEANKKIIESLADKQLAVEEIEKNAKKLASIAMIYPARKPHWKQVARNYN